MFLADKGYDGDFLREELLIYGIRPVIPPKPNRKSPPPRDFNASRERNRTERMFNRLAQFHRVATRYDKTQKSFSAFLASAAAKIWLPYLVNSAYVFFPFKIIVLGIGMHYAIKWHHDQTKKDRELGRAKGTERAPAIQSLNLALRCCSRMINCDCEPKRSVTETKL